MLPSPEIPSTRQEALPLGQLRGIALRSYHPKDQPQVLWLYQHGVLTGAATSYDPAADLQRMEEVYFNRPQDHFWVAEENQQIIGTIAITEDDRQIAHIRRLRVDPDRKTEHKSEIAGALIRTATDHARRHDCLKLVLHTPVNDQRAIEFLHRLGFEYSRARDRDGKHDLEFYLDLYMRPNRPTQT